MAGTRYIALLRGINVGGKNKVPMAELRAMLADLGYADAKTLLQSGNAVFTADTAKGPDGVAAEVEAALEKAYGKAIHVVVRTAAELDDVIAANPFEVPDGAKFLVNFYARPFYAERLADLDVAAFPPEELALAAREIYYNFPDGMRDAKLPTAVDRKLKVLGTGRNWNTVLKLQALAAESADS
ncbi:DUF1697 domain-containing protein [Yinghuangia seranimata]|uniref:DUF1697 domain-containing protein n=1 Tax=Yinghuangia seranimata TaxID=408067 RepID=UPI00248BB305|nr:DUF1697 domain-containing protein [Yinghuangia seranimata]MDI2132962.1 DUF1697 domain-containing protein [Yinghuangia seranimata]